MICTRISLTLSYLLYNTDVISFFCWQNIPYDRKVYKSNCFESIKNINISKRMFCSNNNTLLFNFRIHYEKLKLGSL